ncbi:chromosome transmission fidelity protein 18 homolog [Selaginella moellendorffii]|uniref:chromosome transmission fidelity protein 18 homolog n=1 Tax=Selaginella moellendorffii TaxID=88036 RepID=UPI000D1CBBC6|nr:chromosome transmission fidelity protein 18 homolog [Selaginella moellendorffii]|eukprot:XP_024521567.1 chromosome transmission fidelity protein 18 homolog [Selaginella moellendorffii]
MAMEQGQAMEDEELLMDEAFFDQIQRRRGSDGFEEGRGGFEDVNAGGGEDAQRDLPVKRKLVIPDVCVSPIKSRRVQDAIARKECAIAVEEESTMVLEDCREENFREELDQHHFPRKRAADIAGELISITGPSGERVYAEVDRNFSPQPVLREKKQDQLLSMPIEKMIEQLELEQFKQACELAEKEKDPIAVSAERIDQLWVDKYSPKSFTELLSDEQINREVLSWLKQWDLCVYGVTRHSTPKEVLKALQQHKLGQQPSDNKFKRYEAKGKWNSVNDNKSSSGHDKSSSGDNKSSSGDRPDQKVLLLCGPPGLGKTTLAHVAAKHCGYRVVEINASDDRTASSFQTKILDALQMKTVTGDSKPNCLILDEIDGAVSGTEGKSSVSFLVDLLSAEAKAVSRNDNDDKMSKPQRKKTAIARLSRPIICICNDLYAPALRPLRQIARIHIFSPPSPHRIVTRLNFICKSEGYKVDTRALAALAVHTESDIRSCLNTLQFLFRNGQSLKALEVASQVIGKKDMTSSMFDIWLETFWTRNRTRMKQAHTEFSRVHDVYANHGEYDLGMEGIFENFLHVHYHDVYLQKTLQCLEVIGASDIFGRKTASQQQFFLNAYRPSFKLAIRRLISQPVRPKLEWPKSFQRNRQVHAANTEILKSWLTSMTPALSRTILCPSLIQDVLSPLLSILAPKLRPVASNLLSQQEREDLKQLVDTMISYGLRYKKSKADNLTVQKFSGEAFLLDPPLHTFITFKEYAHSHGELSSTIQQMLSHEVEIEAIKRETAKRSSKPFQQKPSGSANNNTIVKSTTIEKRTIVSASTSTGKLVTTSKTEVVKANTVLKKASFFDRFRTGSTEGHSSKREVSTAKRDSRPLLFKFHEGFTNAVKKPVLMRDFL